MRTSIRLQAALSLVALAAVAGCGGPHYVTGSHPYVGGGVPSASTPVYGIAPGVGLNLQPGELAGYFITANTLKGSGSVYRVFWTGQSHQTNTFNEFYGSLWTPGHILGVEPGCPDGSGGFYCPPKKGDMISQPITVVGGERVDFDTFAADGIVGLDVTVDADPLLLELFIDGSADPRSVYFPSTGPNNALSSPPTMPFGLATQP